MSRRSISFQILSAYYNRIRTLLDYLEEIIENSGSSSCQATLEVISIRNHILRETDEFAYHELLTKAYVAEYTSDEQQHSRLAALRITAPSSTMGELIDRAQVKLFATYGRPTNMITLGYRSAELTSKAGNAQPGGRQGISNFFTNTLIVTLKSSIWNTLLDRIGDVLIFHLLTETSIYVPLPNDCFCQLTGPPLIFNEVPKDPFKLINSSCRAVSRYNLVQLSQNSGKRKALDEAECTRPPKKLRTSSTDRTNRDTTISKVKLNETKKLTAAGIYLARPALFYARSYKLGRTGSVILGLPPSHILNRMKSRTWRESNRLIPDVHGELRPGDRDSAFESRHLSKYVFPLQYSLCNVFCAQSQSRDDMFQRWKFSNRENEISSKIPSKTPPRVKNALPLLRQMFRRHTKCGYKVLLDKICPSKTQFIQENASVDRTIILELISEESSQENIKSQNPSTSSKYTASTPRRTAANSLSTPKPKFAEFVCSHEQVFLYVRAVTKAVIPAALWGSNSNRKTVFQNIKQIISGRRYEQMTLHNVMQGLNTSECEWLLPPGKPLRNSHHPEGEAHKRRQLLEEFIFWYFDQFLLQLLKTTFYATESSAFRNRVLYFRQDDWDVLCRPLLDRLISTTFQSISEGEVEELLRQRQLGYSFIRLLPKEIGVRPIVNLRRKQTATDNTSERQLSINQVLSAAFQILKYEKERQAEQLGASVFGPNEIYVKLKSFKKGITGDTGKIPQLYFVKVDVQACFDTIEQSKLLKILKALISEEAYMIHRYGRINMGLGHVRRTFTKTALPEDEHPHFIAFATQLASSLRHVILVDQVYYPPAFCDNIIQLLEDHISTNIVKIGQKYYRQNVGIPQGSILSSLLCSFFYGDLERTVLHSTVEKQNNVLLRLIDDYLFITTDLQDAREFLEIMDKGHPEYGCFISRDKILINFEHELSANLRPDQTFFPWCGYLIDKRNLSVMTDYSRFHDAYLMDSLTVERAKRPNLAFTQKMFQIARAKSHAIYTDTTLNSNDIVCTNIHQAFVLTAMKMHAYIRAAGHAGGLFFVPSRDRERRRRFKNPRSNKQSASFLLDVIHQSIHYGYSSMKNRSFGHVSVMAEGSFGIQRKAVIWLGLHAYHSILSLKPSVYSRAGMLSALQSEMLHPRYRAIRRKLGKLGTESLKKMLSDVQF